ncbi:MAG TPA: hypothetical protein VFV08_03505, partial [Puia sp.]|nr:hypothetical protein [Puia sp.]
VKRTQISYKNSKLSALKTLYDQELRRYLLLHKEAKNRPVKVEMAPSGVKVVMKQTGPNVQAGVFNEENDEFEDFGQFETKTPSMSSNGFSSIPYKDDGSRRSRSKSNISNVSSDWLASLFKRQASDWFATPFEKQERERNIRPAFENEVEQRKEDFKTYVMANLSQFPVDIHGNIISNRSGMPIKNSNLDASIDRLINPRMENMPSPAGTSVLSNIAMKHPYLNNLILARFTTRLKQLLTPKSRAFENTRQQQGKGIYHRKSFKPSLWR